MVAINVVTTNACLSVCPPLRFNGAFARSERCVDALYQHLNVDVDVICFQELVINREKILQQLIKHPFHTKLTYPSFFGSNIRYVHSGLAIASKHPIVKQDIHSFTGPTYHAEAFMAKSILYAHICTGKQAIHVFVTHAQAWSNEKAKKIRQLQFEQMYEFMQKQHIPKQEPVILCGDFNIDFYEHSRMMEDMMHIVHCQLHLPHVPIFTFDPTINELVGTDDASEYITRSQTNGCYEEFLQTGICSCCPKQLIDGICTSLDHLHPTSANIKLIQNISSHPFEIYINVSTTRNVKNVSDHFALLCEFTFADVDMNLEGAPSNKTEDVLRDNRWIGEILWYTLQFALFIGFYYFFYRVIQRRKNR